MFVSIFMVFDHVDFQHLLFEDVRTIKKAFVHFNTQYVKDSEISEGKC